MMLSLHIHRIDGVSCKDFQISHASAPSEALVGEYTCSRNRRKFTVKGTRMSV